ncbi:MAG: DUF1641 domain-containing protein [Bacteroidales bacterium]|nr:DUF1641 domain-containing protein [Bacteroidales bacterium]
MQEQKLKRSAVEDLTSDLTIIGKDMYDSAVAELENHSVELDLEEIKLFTIKLLKNVPTLTGMINMVESLADLAKDAGPIVNEMIIDFTRKLHEFEAKGYFEFFRESGKKIDHVIQIFNHMNVDEIPDYSIWKLLRILRSPEVRKVMTFLLIFMKNIARYDQHYKGNEIQNMEPHKHNIET